MIYAMIYLGLFSLYSMMYMSTYKSVKLRYILLIGLTAPVNFIVDVLNLIFYLFGCKIIFGYSLPVSSVSEKEDDQ